MVRGRKNIRRPWTEENTQRFVQLLASGKTLTQCAATMGRSLRSIRAKFSRLDRTRTLSTLGKRRYEILWSERDDATLKKLIRHCSVEQICERLRRTRHAVWRRTSELGVSKKLPPPWEYCDVMELIRSSAPLGAIKLKHPRTVKAISLHRLRLRKLHASGKLERYLSALPGAPGGKLVSFGGCLPPGLRYSSIRPNRAAYAARAERIRERELEHNRKEAAWRKWRERQGR